MEDFLRSRNAFMLNTMSKTSRPKINLGVSSHAYYSDQDLNGRLFREHFYLEKSSDVMSIWPVRFLA